MMLFTNPWRANTLASSSLLHIEQVLLEALATEESNRAFVHRALVLSV
jgi:hypothetical protein